MEKIRITDADLLELRTLANYLFANHPLAISGDSKYKLAVGESKNQSYILGAAIGYRKKTIYAVMNRKFITRPKLDILVARFAKVEDADKDALYTQHKVRLDRLVTKLTGQIIRENGLNFKETQKHNMIDVFRNTRWYSFERFFDSIERKVIHFEDIVEEGKLGLKIFVGREGMMPWSGKAYCNSSNNYLIIHSLSDAQVDSLPTNYLLRIDRNVNDLDLIIGHITFASDLTQSVISKTTIFEKLSPKEWESAKPQLFKFNDPDTQEIVTREIYKFLYKKNLNWLTSPHSKIITTRTIFTRWHEENDEEKKESRNENVKGAYTVFYQREESKLKKIIEATLIIDDDISGDLTARYEHKVDNGKSLIWEGNVGYSAITRAIFISLTGPKKKSNIESISTIFLILNLPSGERDFTVLSGIISGIRDNYDGAIAMLVLAVKKQDPLNMDIIKDFFAKFSHRASVIPPKTTIASFNDVQLSLGES